MEGDTTFKEHLPIPSNFEDESDSSDEDIGEVPLEDFDQEGPDEWPPDEVDPDQEAPEEVDPDKLNPQKYDTNAVVSMAAAMFTSKTSPDEARLLRCSHANDLGGPDELLHERTVAVLDALAYVSVNKSSPAVAIGLTMKPLQLVVTTNEEIPSTSILEHLDSICSTLQNISDAKFCTCSDPNSQSNVDLREESPPPDFRDENLDSHYNNLFLQIYKYSHDRLQPKSNKKWAVLDRFSDKLAGWRNKVSLGDRFDLDEPHKRFFNTLNKFCLSGWSLRDSLDQFSRSGWQMDVEEMDELKTHWHFMLAHAKDILAQEWGERSMCEHWAMTVFLADEPSDKKEKPLRLQRAIEKLVAFHRHVFTLIRFANSKRMRSTFFSSKITVTPAEQTRPSVLSWPSNKQEWKALLVSIYDKHGLTRSSGAAVERAEQKMKNKAEKYRVAATIHCECAMVAYLYKYAACQAFSYIGVSKLSCKACHYWMVAFNHTMGTTFRTRGSHDKWYPGWARPGLGESANQDKVDAEFLNSVEEELCKHLLGKCMARRSGASDSSGSNESMVASNQFSYKAKTMAAMLKKFKLPY